MAFEVPDLHVILKLVNLTVELYLTVYLDQYVSGYVFYSDNKISFQFGVKKKIKC